MNFEIDPSWKNELASYFESQAWKSLQAFIDQEYLTKTIYPETNKIFNAFNLCPPKNVKVVILGQDPYHSEDQAHGLSFSVQQGVKAPPSLRNIFKELDSDIGIARSDTDLSDWAKQGVLLLNSVLTVEDSKPGSHANRGWEEFTDHVIDNISKSNNNVVFVLWGGYAQKKSVLIDESKHLILTAPHPSPLSSYRGFFGSKPFSKINSYLQLKNLSPISW